MNVNPMQIINQMMNNSQAMRNPMIRNAMQMYQNKDLNGLQNMATNICKERGISLEETKEKVINIFNH